ncbi:MAG: hypothetical protein GXO66_09270 [Euryarchaeota archaeon]|nr:hypothetical protein [Euryarchaeota archaeon]
MARNDRLVAGIVLTVIGVLGLSSGGMGYGGMMGGMPMGGYGMGFGFFPLLISAVFLGITLFGVYLIYEAVK